MQIEKSLRLLGHQMKDMDEQIKYGVETEVFALRKVKNKENKSVYSVVEDTSEIIEDLNKKRGRTEF